MEQELIQAAVNTFCIVPEVYQQVFQQMGAEFPDELVQAIKTKPEDAVKMVQNDKELLKGVVTIYQQYGDKINQAAQATQQTGMFAKGGKLNYLLDNNNLQLNSNQYHLLFLYLNLLQLKLKNNHYHLYHLKLVLCIHLI